MVSVVMVIRVPIARARLDGECVPGMSVLRFAAMKKHRGGGTDGADARVYVPTGTYSFPFIVRLMSQAESSGK